MSTDPHALPFVVGFARCNEPRDILLETLDAIDASTRRPSTLVVIDNGDTPMPTDLIARAGRERRVSVQRWGRNTGCASAWNLIRKRTEEDFPGRRAIILNADCAVAPDTFEKMLEAPTPTIMLAYGFGCFFVDDEIWRAVGPFDEAFYPAYFEDGDYRRRCKLAGIAPLEWPYDTVAIDRPGRMRAASGITHGSHDPDGYQGWRGEKLATFWGCYEKNRQHYIAKWGGEPGKETFATPFGGFGA